MKSRMDSASSTLGPASSEPEVIAALFEAGVNVVRLNFSHGSHEDHAEQIGRVHALGVVLAANRDLSDERTDAFVEGRAG